MYGTERRGSDRAGLRLFLVEPVVTCHLVAQSRLVAGIYGDGMSRHHVLDADSAAAAG